MDALPNQALALITSKLPTGARTVCRRVCRRLCNLINENVQCVRINEILPSTRNFDAKFPRLRALEIRGVRDEQLQDFLLGNEAFLRQLEGLTICAPSNNSRRWLMGWICLSCINLQQLDLTAERVRGLHNHEEPDLPSAAVWALAKLSRLRTLDLCEWHIPTPSHDFAALVAFTNLSSLTFSCEGLHSQDIQLLSTLGRLDHLGLESISLLSEKDTVTQVLRAAALVTRLRLLDLLDSHGFRGPGQARIEADNASILSSFQNLEDLHINGFALVDMQLLSSWLRPVTTLRILKISEASSYAGVEPGCSELEHVLHLSMDWSCTHETLSTSFLQACHDNLPSLKFFELFTRSPLTAAQMNVVTTLTGLTSLRLDSKRSGNLRGMEAPLAGLLHHMTGLRKLHCTAVLDAAALSSLASMPVLEELIVHEVLPLDQPLQRQFSSLRKFESHTCAAHDDSALMLCRVMPDLRELSARWPHLSADGLREVGLALPRLNVLGLHGLDECEPWGFETTSELNSLIELHLSYCRTLTLTTVERILQRRYLDKLRVQRCPLISEDALQAVLLKLGRADLTFTL